MRFELLTAGTVQYKILQSSESCGLVICWMVAQALRNSCAQNMEATYWFGTLVAQTVRRQIPLDLQFNLRNYLYSVITLPVIRF